MKPATIEKDANPETWKYYMALAVILLLSFIVYFPILKNGFVWDDEYYIINNTLIKDLSWKGIKAIFTNFSSDNYAPLTDLINTLQYKISGLSPAAFHFGSLIFHLLNVALVFWFIRLVCNNWIMAAITALFFGIHPMQVESVAWASGGSNLFCAAFFLGSLVAYLYYLGKNLKRYLFIALLFFFLSLLTKAVAVVLPVLLLLIDFYKDRKITIRNLLEKSPFFILSLGAGILSLLLKYQVFSITDVSVFSFSQRVIFASYGFITYLFKLLFPFNLSAYYPYPIKSGANIPIQYYACILLFFGLIVYVIYSLRFSKKIFLGMGFFAVNIFIVLQLLPVGNAFMADRYIYIPSIGIFYLAGEGFNLFWNKKPKMAALLLLGVFTLFFSVKTYARCGVWKTDMALWNSVIGQYENVPVAYYNRGNLFMNEQRNNEAIADFTKAIELNPKYAMAYNNRGSLLMNENRKDEALSDFNKSIELDPGYANVYYNRGNLFLNDKRNEEAMNDFNKAIELDPGFVEPYIMRGTLFKYQKRNDEALNDFNKAIELKPGYAVVYYNRGILFMTEKRNDEAIIDFTKAIELKPDYVKAYYNRGVLLSNKKKYEEAISNFTNAIALKTDYADAYFNRGLAQFYSGKKDAACEDLNKAAGLGHKLAADAISQICK